MAKLKKSVLGKITGAVGDLVFRLKNGNNYVGVRPSSFMPGTDAASIKRRSRFGVACKFAKAVNKSLPLRNLWKLYAPAILSPFNFIMKTNYHYVRSLNITDSVTLVPDIGFNLTGTTLTANDTEIKASTDAIGAGSGVDIALEPYLQGALIVHLSSPVSTDYKPVEYITVTFGKIASSLTEPIALIHPLSEIEKTIFARYRDKKMYFAIVSLDADDVPVHFSNTEKSA